MYILGTTDRQMDRLMHWKEGGSCPELLSICATVKYVLGTISLCAWNNVLKRFGPF